MSGQVPVVYPVPDELCLHDPRLSPAIRRTLAAQVWAPYLAWDVLQRHGASFEYPEGPGRFTITASGVQWFVDPRTATQREGAIRLTHGAIDEIRAWLAECHLRGLRPLTILLLVDTWPMAAASPPDAEGRLFIDSPRLAHATGLTQADWSAVFAAHPQSDGGKHDKDGGKAELRSAIVLRVSQGRELSTLLTTGAGGRVREQ